MMIYQCLACGKTIYSHPSLQLPGRLPLLHPQRNKSWHHQSGSHT